MDWSIKTGPGIEAYIAGGLELGDFALRTWVPGPEAKCAD